MAMPARLAVNVGDSPRWVGMAGGAVQGSFAKPLRVVTRRGRCSEAAPPLVQCIKAMTRD